jgi:hypothetical protein
MKSWAKRKADIEIKFSKERRWNIISVGVAIHVKSGKDKKKAGGTSPSKDVFR